MSNAPTCTQCGVVIDYRSATGLCNQHYRELSNAPADFAEYCVHRTQREISKHYGVCRNTVQRWRRELAIETGKRVAWNDEDDAYLRANIRSASLESIAAHLGRTVGAVKGRASNLQLKTGRPVGWVRRELNPAPMMAGHSGEAAYLQGYGPIFRCHKDGTQAAIGAYWYWAGQVLTHSEMEAKARSHRERRALLDMAA